MFAIRYRIEDDRVVVASSGFDQPESRGWWTLDNMTVLTVAFDTSAPHRPAGRRPRAGLRLPGGLVSTERERVALVTGAAGGIGAATARTLGATAWPWCCTTCGATAGSTQLAAELGDAAPRGHGRPVRPGGGGRAVAGGRSRCAGTSTSSSTTPASTRRPSGRRVATVEGVVGAHARDLPGLAGGALPRGDRDLPRSSAAAGSSSTSRAAPPTAARTPTTGTTRPPRPAWWR